MNKEIIVLAERDNETLIKIVGKMKVGDQYYTSVRHEWWYDKGKMKQNIPCEGNAIYMRGFAGSTDKKLLKMFNKALK